MDVFGDDPAAQIGIDFPFWIKPVKCPSSAFAYRVGDAEELSSALQAIREGIGEIANAFDELVSHAHLLPEEVRQVSGSHCIVEGVLPGVQCTACGFVYAHEVEVYGVVDSLTHPGSSVFQRLQYPSSLPESVQDRIADASWRLIAHIGLDDGAFNIEFLYDEESGSLGVLEINPRISQSHGQIFDYVDGAADHQVMLDLALGRRPDLPRGRGPYAVAAKCYHRRFEDAFVERVPRVEELRAIEEEIPGVMLKTVAQRGIQLSEMREQDSSAYDLAYVWMGAEDEPELERLDFRFSERGPGPAGGTGGGTRSPAAHASSALRHVSDLPQRVRELEHVWIPMPDGTRLAARLWMPEDAEARPVPAILEYIPYRKRDGTAPRDALMHPWFAGHGYACVRVDLRGSGDSEGILRDEYLPQELDDGLEVLRWIARQPWCDGKVGMMGISWGGFNALQIAALQPEALKAVVTVCSTDDRYADDVHYMGGVCWATTFPGPR